MSDSYLVSILNGIDTGFWVNILILALAKSAVLLLGLAAWLCWNRSASASVRHFAISLALVGLLVLPVATITMPAWEFGVFPAPPAAQNTTGVGKVASPSPPIKTSEAMSPQADSLTVSAAVMPRKAEARFVRQDRALLESGPQSETVEGNLTPPQGRRAVISPKWAVLLLALWIVGSGFFLARLLLGVLIVRREIRRSAELLDPSWRRMAAHEMARLRLKRTVRLLENDRLEVALSAGIWRPVVLIPRVAGTWSASRRRSILLHELCHTRRWDNFVNLLAQFCCALYWFNPLMWWSANRLQIERERACDDLVLSLGTRPSDYATHLLEIARAISARRLWGQLEVSQSSALKDRVMAVLDSGVNRRIPAPDVLAATVVVASMALLPFAAFQPWTSTAQESRMPSRAASSWLVVQPPPPGLERNQEDASFMEPYRQAADDAAPLVSSARPDSAVMGRAGAHLATEAGQIANLIQSSFQSAAFRLMGGSQNSRRSEFPEVEALVESDTGGPGGAFSGRRTHFSRRRTPTSSGGGENPGPPQPGAEDPEWVIAGVRYVDLGTLGGFESRASAINDAGQVVGESRIKSGVVHPFLWTNQGGMIDLGEQLSLNTRATQISQGGHVVCETFDTYLFRGFLWSEEAGLQDIGSLDQGFPLTIPNAVNNSGIVVGASRDSSGVLRAVAWARASGLTELGVPGWSEALAVNNRGEVVGYGGNEAFLWSPEKGLQIISSPGTRFSIATSINNRGEVVGYAEYEPGVTRGFYWSEETGHVDLGVLGAEYPISLALAINDAGQVVGQAMTPPTRGPIQIRAFLWSKEHGLQDIGSSSQTEGAGPVPETELAINALGQVVGVYADDLISSGNRSALLWTEAGTIPLVADQEETGALAEPVAANNKNQIVGSRVDTGQLRSAALWELILEAKTSDF